MRFIYEQAVARARALGYGGEYVGRVARDTVGMTEAEIAVRREEYAEAARDERRRAAYARAAERETDLRRRAHYATVAAGGR